MDILTFQDLYFRDASIITLYMIFLGIHTSKFLNNKKLIILAHNMQANKHRLVRKSIKH